MSSNVVLHVALYRTHVGRVLVGRFKVVDNFIASEETQQVGVTLESLDDCEDMLEVVACVCALRVAAVDVLSVHGGVDVENNIDSYTLEQSFD